jgi:hypothetical protein
MFESLEFDSGIPSLSGDGCQWRVSTLRDARFCGSSGCGERSMRGTHRKPRAHHPGFAFKCWTARFAGMTAESATSSPARPRESGDPGQQSSPVLLALDSRLRGNERSLATCRSITTRQYARLVSQWIASIGLDPSFYGTHSLRRTKATLIYRRTGNLRAVQLLFGHRKIEGTVRFSESRLTTH